MTTDAFDFVTLPELRVGLFVDLDLGWMAHPFPSSRFKISNDRQIEILRGLGVDRIRFVPSRSDPAPVAPVAATSSSPALTEAARQAQVLCQQREALRSLQQESLRQCERRFGEAVQQYKKAMDLLDTRPQEATPLCQSLVSTLTTDLVQTGDAAIRLLTEVAGDKAAVHPVNVTVISLLLGKAMGVQGTELSHLGLAAFLHDIGKSRLPERVRRWDDGFTAAEQKVYQDHVAQSVLLGRQMGLEAGVLDAMAQHHEMVDGSGFPQRLKAEGISLNARILALVNRYDGLCNPAKPAAAMTPHEALAQIFAQQKSRFDGVVLSAFIRMMGVYPPGSVVQLNDERHAIVVAVNSSRPLKPRILVHEPSVPRSEAVIVDLEDAPNVNIRRSLKPSSLPTGALDYLQPRPRVCYFFEPVVKTSGAAAAA